MNKSHMYADAFLFRVFPMLMLSLLSLAVPAAADVVTNVFENISVSATADVTGALNAVPELLPRQSIAGTNGTQMVVGRIARPFRVDKILVANAIPTNGTVVVWRERSGVTESIATVTCVDGTGSASVASPVYLYAQDYVWFNGPGMGTATNASVETHGRRF